MHHSTPRHQFSTLSEFICYFSCIYWFFWAKWPWNWKALQITIIKGWKLAWYHHFTHIACAKKLRGLRQKLDALRVQNRQSLSKYQGFGRKLVCFQRISIFLTYFNSRLFMHLIWTIRSHILKFQPYLTSLVIFHAFNELFWAKWPWN